MKTGFTIGETVYLKSDPAQLVNFVTGLVNRGNGVITLMVACMGSEIEVHPYEISKTPQPYEDE